MRSSTSQSKANIGSTLASPWEKLSCASRTSKSSLRNREGRWNYSTWFWVRILMVKLTFHESISAFYKSIIPDRSRSHQDPWTAKQSWWWDCSPISHQNQRQRCDRKESFHEFHPQTEERNSQELESNELNTHFLNTTSKPKLILTGKYFSPVSVLYSDMRWLYLCRLDRSLRVLIRSLVSCLELLPNWRTLRSYTFTCRRNCNGQIIKNW